MANLRRRHYKLNSKVIEAVRHLAEYGAALEHIAAAVGVSYEAITLWLRNAKGSDPTEEKKDQCTSGKRWWQGRKTRVR